MGARIFGRSVRTPSSRVPNPPARTSTSISGMQLQQLPAQAHARHILNVVLCFRAEFLANHGQVALVFEVIMEGAIAEFEQFGRRDALGGQRFAVVAVLRKTAPAFRDLPFALEGEIVEL